MGESQIIKDNFLFGLNEKKEVYDKKADGDDLLRNRDANKHADRRCDLWLCFDNGVRLSVEMQDSRKADMAQVPPAFIPDWLKEKIEKANRADEAIAIQSELEASVHESNLKQEDQDEKPAEDVARASQASVKPTPMSQAKKSAGTPS